MKILQLHTRYREPGGEDIVVRSEAELLRSAGHEVVTHVASNPEGTAASLAGLALSAGNPLAAREVTALARELRPDVAHVHNTWYALTPAVVRALDKAGVPVVVTLHNYRMLCANADLLREGSPCEDCVGKIPWRGVTRRCYRGSAVASAASATSITANRLLGTWDRHAALLLVMSEFAKRLMIRGGLPAERLVVKPNFVGDPGPRTSAPSASRRLLFAGRLEERKGIAPLLDAWARLGPEPGLELMLFGDGPLRGELEARALPGVIFAGHRSPDEVRREMLAARTLVFPSVLYEGLPMVVLEAFAAGLPVLASRLGASGELVGSAGDGWTAPARDTAAWTGALRTLAADGDRVDAASGVVRSMYEERFTQAMGLANLERAYARAIAERGPAVSRGLVP